MRPIMPVSTQTAISHESGGVGHLFFGVEISGFGQSYPVAYRFPCHQLLHTLAVFDTHEVGGVFGGMEGRTHLMDILISASDIGVIEEYENTDRYKYSS